MVERTARTVRERKKINKNQVVVWFIVGLVLLAVLMTVLYCNTAGDARALKKMRMYEFSGSSTVLSVDDVMFGYNGKDIKLYNGTFTFSDTDKIKNMTSYSYHIYLQEQGKEEKIPILSNSSMDTTVDFTKPIAIGSVDGSNEGIDFKKFAEKYSVGFRLDITTTSGLVSEEIFLKITELDTDFFRGMKES